MTNLKSWLNAKALIGDPKKVSLEGRIFNTFSIIAFLAMAIEVPFNFGIGLITPGWICVFGFVFSGFLYYISRIKRKSRLGIYLFSIVANIAFSLNYFYNSGIYGPNLLLFVIAFLMIIAIIPKEHFRIWLPINIVVVIGILVYEYFHPIRSAYRSELAKSVDFGVTYLVMVIITYYAITYIRRNYDTERNAVLEKSLEIEEQNKRISEQKLELEKINSEKNKLFSIISHDIRSPLNAIQGYLEILTLTELFDEERLDIKKRLLQTTKDTAEMVTNLLMWSQSQLHGTSVDLTKIDVDLFIAQNLNVERELASKKDVGLVLECVDGLQILADKNMLQIILRNLVNNAIKFTPEKGLIQILAYRNNTDCVVKIIDDGLGVPKNVENQLFNLKATSTYGTNNEKGVGLGLLLCKEFVELQNGRIWYEHGESKGSVFAFSFPLAN